MAAVAPAINENSKPTSPVDLSTIPISPAGGEKDTKPNGENGEEQITVFHDKDNFNVKHPLMHKWTLWFTKPPSGKACSLILFGELQFINYTCRVTTGTIC
jgi:translation initiation factor 4E